MSSITPTTELDAVNIILSSIGEAPVSSLQNLTAADSVAARDRLHEISKTVQTEGWQFNSERDFKLTPDATTSEITLPANCVRVDTTGIDQDIDVAQRGNRLYDKGNQTYQFKKPLNVDMVLLLPFEDLPETARYYITIRAARVFQTRSLGSESLYRFNAEDERMAYRTFKRAEGITGDYNILKGQPASRILRR